MNGWTIILVLRFSAWCAIPRPWLIVLLRPIFNPGIDLHPPPAQVAVSYQPGFRYLDGLAVPLDP